MQNGGHPGTVRISRRTRKPHRSSEKLCLLNWMDTNMRLKPCPMTEILWSVCVWVVICAFGTHTPESKSVKQIDQGKKKAFINSRERVLHLSNLNSVRYLKISSLDTHSYKDLIFWHVVLAKRHDFDSCMSKAFHHRK